MNKAPSLSNRPTFDEFHCKRKHVYKKSNSQIFVTFEMTHKKISHIFEYDYTSKVLLDILVLEKNYTFLL